MAKEHKISETQPDLGFTKYPDLRLYIALIILSVRPSNNIGGQSTQLVNSLLKIARDYHNVKTLQQVRREP
ncbi:hypothetical protein HMPREF1981_01261 [Bacteroides pyogenes F0041]|uniref:Uncharacterized protein n=1 Tax=Bacteroides pyogenes F0041 TaxID=1321819 RepID=U2E0X4_9BACE|nr:hypothetical protein HMPREF1981_01261 [Bacteroides pyogenes F0041]